MMRVWAGLSIALLALSLTPAAWSQDKEEIRKRADYAVRFLQSIQKPGGGWDYAQGGNPQYDVAATSLAGLALLESGVERNDRSLTSAAETVRRGAGSLTSTYAIASAIMFLDRYYADKQKNLIQTLGIRLAASQDQNSGGWGYECQMLSAPVQAQWLDFLKKHRNGPFNFQGRHGAGGQVDNSNTQFAVLALWIASRQGIPMDYPLALAEHRFRSSQGGSGGWTYGLNIGAGASRETPSMTCAGLLALAMAFGTQRERQATLRAGGEGKLDEGKPVGRMPADLRVDPAVQKAKNFLQGALNIGPEHTEHWLYFLWSLERVCVIFKFDDINGVDWYAYGCHHLLPRQNRDGSWTMEHGAVIDTSFALLFLNKANLADDLSLTATLRSEGSDPLRNPTAPKSGSTGPTSQKTVPRDKAPAEAKRLLDELTTANEARQMEILTELESTKDETGSFTDALIDAVGKLKAKMQDKARECLVSRLSRLSAKSLRARMEETDSEVLLATIKACGVKGDLDLVPDLIEFLKNSNEAVAQAAEDSLKSLSDGKDFGRHQDRWREWHRKQKR